MIRRGNRGEACEWRVMSKVAMLAYATAALAFALFFFYSCTNSREVASPAVTVSSLPAAQALASDPPYAYTLIIGTSYASQGHDHIADNASTDFAYNSDPPTSGPHKDIYLDTFDSPTPLPKYVQVNLLEHADVLVQYNCDCPGIVDALHRIAYRYDRDWIRPNQLEPTPFDAQDAEYEGWAVIVAPYPGMSHEIALTAWDRLGTLDYLDNVKIDDFIHAYLHNVMNAVP
jgi:Protein of unknown function (DUF3105)